MNFSDPLHLTLLLVGLYFIVIFIIGFTVDRSQRHQGFVIGQHNVGAVALGASVAASFRDLAFSGFWIIFGFLYGLGPAITMFIGFWSSFILLLRLTKGLRARARQRGYVSVSDMVQDFGPWSANMVRVFLLIFTLIFAGSQVYLMVQLGSELFGISKGLIVVANLFLVLFYLWVGGYANIVRTDLLQVLFLFFFMAIIFFLPQKFEPNLLSAKEYTSPSTLVLISLGISMAFTAVSLPDYYQRLFSAKSDAAVHQGTHIGVLMMLVLSTFFCFLGMALRDYVPELPDSVFGALFQVFSGQPLMFAVLALGCVVMAMSTVDTQAYLFSSMLTKDILKVDPEKERDRYIQVVRWCFVVFTVLIAASSLMVGDFLNYMLNIATLGTTLTPILYLPAIRAKPKPVEDKIAFFGTAVGTVLFLWNFITGAYAGSLIFLIVPPILAWILVGAGYFIYRKQIVRA